jgi:hypothetical protein
MFATVADSNPANQVRDDRSIPEITTPFSASSMPGLPRRLALDDLVAALRRGEQETVSRCRLAPGAGSPGSRKTPRWILRPVDGAALASVITSSVPVIAVIATSGVAVWSARQSAKLARETRVQQRLAES